MTATLQRNVGVHMFLAIMWFSAWEVLPDIYVTDRWRSASAPTRNATQLIIHAQFDRVSDRQVVDIYHGEVTW